MGDVLMLLTPMIIAGIIGLYFLIKAGVKAYKRSGFFGGKKFYWYLLPVLSFALQCGAIYLVAIGELYFHGLFYFVVGWAITLLVVYGPFVIYLSNASEGFGNIGALGLFDWFITVLHLPLFVIVLILIIIGLIGKDALENDVGPSSGGTGSKDNKKYHIDTECGTHYVKDEFGNTVDIASVDYSGKGDYKGSDGSTYKKKD
ncbi:MAG: hypothetical protein IJQ87_03690 [Clostridia bacterium]|nr:hypothetical protein [Clostridia bacterium]